MRFALEATLLAMVLNGGCSANPLGTYRCTTKSEHILKLMKGQRWESEAASGTFRLEKSEITFQGMFGIIQKGNLGKGEIEVLPMPKGLEQS